MKIEYVERGFVQYFDNDVIEKIAYLGDYIKVGTIRGRDMDDKIVEVDNVKFFGTCTVYFHNKPPKELHNVNFEAGYNSQYGIPVSADGSKLFVGHWRKSRGKVKNGLQAYDVESDSLLWWLNEGKIREIFVYSNYLVALQANGAIFKVDIDSGDVLGQIKSGTIESQFELDSPYILVDSIRDQLSVVDTEKMEVVKTYGSIYKSKTINPSNCYSIVIREVVLQDDVLTISGFEGCPDGDYSSLENTDFTRVIDTSFSSM